MKKIIFLYLAIVSFALTFSSCSSTDDAENRVEAAKIVESRSNQDLLNDLYLACDGDVESLSRILQVTPSSIDRLRNGKTEATEKFEERTKTVAIYYYQNDRKFSLVQSALDDEYGWYDSILNFPSHHPWIFWSEVVILSLIFASILICPLLSIIFTSAIGVVFTEILIFLIAWIASLICKPDAMQDNFTNTINPTIEQVL